jgi:hypothetical protein
VDLPILKLWACSSETFTPLATHPASMHDATKMHAKRLRAIGCPQEKSLYARLGVKRSTFLAD